MNDPWKYVAFPIAAVSGYLISLGVTRQLQAYIGLSTFLTRLGVIALTGLVAGFMVDEVIPAYVHEVRSGSGLGGGGSDLGGGDSDFDLE